MSNATFWRLAWKEYRVQRAFWIAMVLLTVLLQLIVLVLANPSGAKIVWLFSFGLGFSSLYALGCGATLFATEHETGTYEFQKTLPVAATPLFLGKLAFAVVSTAAMIGLMWLLSAVLTGWQLPDPERHRALWGFLGFGAVELLVWGVFFSLQSTKPLKAAVLGMTAASFSAHFTSVGMGTKWSMELFQAALPQRAAVVALVAIADVWLGQRWLRAAAGVSRGAVGLRLFKRTAGPRALTQALARPLRGSVLLRLVWQQWRQSTGMMVALGILAVPMAMAGFAVWTTGASISRDRVLVSIVLASAMASLMGSCVFLGDQQRRRFRFLAEQGVRPGYVWLSRQVVWMVPVALLTAAVLPLVLFGNESLRDGWGRNADLLSIGYWYEEFGRKSVLIADVAEVRMLFGCVGLAYASGQLCSMMLRSGLLAAVFGLLLSIVLGTWALAMGFLELNWLWSVAPIPLLLLAATWLRTPDWLLQRNRLRAWLRPGLTLIVPAVALLVAVPRVRVNEVPLTDPGFSPGRYARPITAAEQKTVDMYQRAAGAFQSLRPKNEAETEGREDEDREARRQRWLTELTPRRAAWVAANQEAIALTIAASRRKECDFFGRPEEDRLEFNIYRLRRVLIASGVGLQWEGKLDEALQRYTAVLRVSNHLRQRSLDPYSADDAERHVYDCLPYWAAHPDQTPERIRAAMGRLDELDRQRPPLTDALKSAYVRMRGIIRADPETMAAADISPRSAYRLTLWAQCLPWEATRAVRMLNGVTSGELREVEEAELEARQGREISFYRSSVLSRFYGDAYYYDAFYRHRRGDAFSMTRTLYADIFRRLASVCQESSFMVAQLERMETRRRAVRLVLALQAWRIEHGELPETLNALVGPYLDRVPTDPFSGEPFVYFPQGLPEAVRWGPGFSRYRTVQADTPFVWSTGARVSLRGYIPEDEDEDDVTVKYYVRRDPRGYGGSPTSEHEVWEAGLPFALPQRTPGNPPVVPAAEEAGGTDGFPG